MPERGHRRWVSVLPVSATPAASMQTASSCTSASLWREQTRLAGRFAERRRNVIMSPGSRERATNPHMHSGNNPESSSMEFHRARGRRINHRNKGHGRGQQHPEQHRGVWGGGAGSKQRCENNFITPAPSDRSGRLSDTLHFQRWQLL